MVICCGSNMKLIHNSVKKIFPLKLNDLDLNTEATIV